MKNFTAKGFTLVELLVVIAILGILAAVLLIGVNPLEQMARGRDASRKNIVAQLGHAMESYVTNQATGTGSASYPAASTTWQTALKSNNEIKSTANVTGPNSNATICPMANQEGTSTTGVCYATTAGGNAVVWTFLESRAEYTKSICTTAGQFAAAVWISAQGRAGTACLGAVSSIPTDTTSIY